MLIALYLLTHPNYLLSDRRLPANPRNITVSLSRKVVPPRSLRIVRHLTSLHVAWSVSRLAQPLQDLAAYLRYRGQVTSVGKRWCTECTLRRTQELDGHAPEPPLWASNDSALEFDSTAPHRHGHPFKTGVRRIAPRNCAQHTLHICPLSGMR